MKFFKCSECNQVIVKLIEKENQIMCCDSQMEELSQNHTDDKSNVHKLSVRKAGNFLTVTVGDDHPMVDVHHIAMIVVETNQGFQYKNLHNQEKAKAEFVLSMGEELVNAYAYCNVHLLWRLN